MQVKISSGFFFRLDSVVGFFSMETTKYFMPKGQKIHNFKFYLNLSVTN